MKLKPDYTIKMLWTTTLHNSMILSTLSISSHGFAFGFPKALIPMEMYSLLINSWWFPKLANVGLLSNNSQQSSPRTKYTIEPPLRPIVPSNSLPLIEAWLFLWSPWTKYAFCSALEPLFTTRSRLTTSCSTFEDFIDMAKLRAGLWYHVMNHNSPHWYDIVHFEHKLLWLCFGLPQKVSYQWKYIPYL